MGVIARIEDYLGLVKNVKRKKIAWKIIYKIVSE